MMSSLVKWWTRDTALHSYVFCQFLINLPFAVFNTYVIYQIQVVGFIIGTDESGGPCSTYCIVEWGGSRLDVSSVLLYLNAIGFALGGGLTLFLSAYSDCWSRKHLLVAFFIICFGALAVPVYWLQDTTNHNFQTLTGLYTVFAVVTLILVEVLQIYIPHCMRTSTAGTAPEVNYGGERDVTGSSEVRNAQRDYAFSMSVYTTIFGAVGATLMFIIVVILSATLSSTASQSAGLLVVTVVGFLTLAGSSVAFFGLPPIPARGFGALKGRWTEPFIEFFRPLKQLFVRKNMALLLISFTIYTDSLFAVSSVTGQLYFAELRPGTLEYTLYSLAQSILNLVCGLFFWKIRALVPMKLETWLLIGYALILVIPVWGCIGFADVHFGFKYRWEFYVQQLLFSLSSALVNTCFRVLFSEMVPVGNEVRWFGMQLVLSCATTWINYVASAPLQNVTHQLRFPLVFSLVFLFLALVIEICRNSFPMFKRDQLKWAAIDQRALPEESEPEAAPEICVVDASQKPQKK